MLDDALTNRPALHARSDRLDHSRRVKAEDVREGPARKPILDKFPVDRIE